MNEFIRIAGYIVDMQNSVAFPYNNNKHAKKGIRKKSIHSSLKN